MDAITGIRCRNAVTGAVSDLGMNALGTGKGSTSTSLDCNNGSFDGLRGFQVWDDGELNRLVGKCTNPDASAFHFSGGIGSGTKNYHPDDQCPVGQMVYAVEGGPSKDGGQVTQFKFFCKDIQTMRNIAADAAARGKCAIGDDNSASCAEIKNSLGSGDDDRNAYCTSGTNVADRQSCRVFFNQNLNNATYRAAMLAYCKQGDNYTSDLCRAFCTSSSDDGTPVKGECDDLYMTKCRGNPSPLCSCLQDWSTYPGSASIDQLKGAPQRPDCYFANCIGNGYKKQQSESCPQCVQTIQASGGVNALTIGNIVQSCTVPGALAPAPTVAPTAAGPAPTPAAQAAAQAQTPAVQSNSARASSSSSTLLILLAVLSCVIIAIMAAVIL